MVKVVKKLVIIVKGMEGGCCKIEKIGKKIISG